jgi:hypothetical protein
MRSSTSWILRALSLLPALGLAGCGTWSNEDLRYYEALPTSPELRLAVPAAPTAVAAAPGQPLAARFVCGTGLGSSGLWEKAKPTSDDINRSIDWVLGLVDVVRPHPPTTRLPDGRIWGPFDDQRHPGLQIRIVIMRSFPGGPDLPQHDYAFEARRVAGADPFQPILEGSFVGPSARRGHGGVVLHFDTIWALGMADADAPHGVMEVRYDRSAEPRTIQLVLAQAGFNLVQFDYAFQGYLDGRGRFDFAVLDARGDRIEFNAGFDAAGAGEGVATFTTAAGATGSFRQCWKSTGCLSRIADPTGYSCPGGTPCDLGTDAVDCPVVPP